MQMNYWNIGKALGVILAVYLGMKYLLPMIIPFLIAWILVRMILPWTRFLKKRWRIRQEISGMILLFLIGVAAAGVLYVFVSQLMLQICKLSGAFDDMADKIQLLVSTCCAKLEKNTGIHASAIENFVYENLMVMEKQLKAYSVSGMVKNSIGYVCSLMKGIGVFAVMMISMIMFLKDDEQISRKMKEHRIFCAIQKIISSMQVLGGAWLKAQIVIILIVAGVCVFGLWLLKYPYALLMGISIGLFDAFPFIGTGTVLIPWAVYKMITGNVCYGICLVILFFAANTIREYLEPKLIGDRIGIYPIFMMAAVYIGIYIYGWYGVLLGPVSLLLILELWKELGVCANV